MLDKGIVIAGDIQINLLDIELLTIKLRLLIASVDRAREMGIDWWESDSSLQKLDPGDSDGNGTGSSSARTRSCASGSSDSSARWSPPVADDLLWAYGVVPAGATLPATNGIAGGVVQPVAAGELVALTSRVPRREFGAEPLRERLNDLEWLERVAREHEAVLEHVLAGATLVPLRLCTIFDDADGVSRMLERERDALTSALGAVRRTPGMGGEAAGRRRSAGGDCCAGRGPGAGRRGCGLPRATPP